MCCEWNYPAGVTNCKVVCTGTAGFGHVLVLVLGWGSLPLWGSGGGAGLERHDSVFVEITGRYYWHVGAKDANYPIMLSILCYIMITLCSCWEKSFFVHLTGRECCWVALSRVGTGSIWLWNFLVTGEMLCWETWIFFVAVCFLLFWVCFLVTGLSILVTGKRYHPIINVLEFCILNGSVLVTIPYSGQLEMR